MEEMPGVRGIVGAARNAPLASVSEPHIAVYFRLRLLAQLRQRFDPLAHLARFLALPLLLVLLDYRKRTLKATGTMQR